MANDQAAQAAMAGLQGTDCVPAGLKRRCSSTARRAPSRAWPAWWSLVARVRHPGHSGRASGEGATGPIHVMPAHPLREQAVWRLSAAPDRRATELELSQERNTHDESCATVRL